jgi:hypothetical protein
VTDTVLILHILVFGAWLGTDLATFYLSRRVLDTGTEVPTRAHLAKVMLGVEVIARLCLPTTLVLGLTLSIDLGYLAVAQWWILPVWLLGGLWVAMVWAIHRDGGTGGPAVALTGLDLWVRSAVCLAVLAAGVVTVVDGEPFSVLWLGIKLLAFGTIMAIGIRVRFLLRPFSAAFGRLVVEGSSPEREAAVRVALRRAHPYVIGIWAMLALAVSMAVVRPT